MFRFLRNLFCRHPMLNRVPVEWEVQGYCPACQKHIVNYLRLR